MGHDPMACTFGLPMVTLIGPLMGAPMVSLLGWPWGFTSTMTYPMVYSIVTLFPMGYTMGYALAGYSPWGKP